VSMRVIALFSLGRDALWWLGCEIQPRIRDAWLPEYCCSQVVRALAASGLRVHTYPLTSELGVDWGELPGAVSSGREGLFVIVDMLGFPQRIADVHREQLRGMFGFVLRDAAQGLPLEGLDIVSGSQSGLAMFSLRKALPLPDLAMLCCSAADACEVDGVSNLGLRRPHRGALARRSYARLERLLLRRPRYRDVLGMTELRSLLKAASPYGQPPTEGSKELFATMNLRQAADTRRRHAERLLETFESIALFSSIPPNSAPYYFPVLVDAPDSAQRAMAHWGIRCTRLWGSRGLLRKDSSAAAIETSRRLLCLPVNQRLSDEQIEKTCEIGARVLL